jgi:acyl-CoA synthetase (AMP-forming)/AMP-acid ligase II
MSFNLAVILSETAQSSPDQPVAVFAGGELTYRELDQASDRLAAGLATAGLRPGDPVALQLPNIPQFLVSYFGILKAGGVVVPLNVMLRAPEVAFHLSDSGARILITWDGVLAEAAKGAEAAGLDQVYAVGHANDSGAGDSGGADPFERLLDTEVPHFKMATREPVDTAVIVYTSGTTGRPKGAELTHIQLYMNADIPGRLFDVSPGDVVITVLPLFHVFGLSSILDICVRFGCTMSLLPRYTPGAVLTAIQRDRATIFEGVPTMFADLLSQPDLDRYDLATASAFTGDWLHTGDLGYFDQDGFLFIVSRKKELIIRGGENVYPSEIENVLCSHPAVAEAAVVGTPDSRLGEEVMAVVIRRPGMDLLESELVSYCRQRLAAYKCPRVFQFRSELPKNSLGKVLKDELLSG